MKGKIITALYFLIGLANLTAHLMASEKLELYTKPLLMPVLIYLLFVEAKGVVNLPRLLVAGALVCSWAGDVALLYPNLRHSFLVGLGSFLIAQILYLIAMNKAAFSPLKPTFKKLWPVLLYGMLLAGILLPNTGQLMIPTTIYALSILLMLSAALLRKEKTTDESYKLVATGAILFVVSDSILAMDRFGYAFEWGSFLVMATYIVAQFLIAKGILKHPG